MHICFTTRDGHKELVVPHQFLFLSTSQDPRYKDTYFYAHILTKEMGEYTISEETYKSIKKQLLKLKDEQEN